MFLALTLSWAAERVPEALSLDGIPPIDPALLAEAQQISLIRSAGLNSFSLDGSQILISTRFANTSQLHRVDAPLGQRTQLTFGQEPTGSGSFIPGTQDILFTRDIGGNEQFQLYRQAPNQPPQRISSGEGRVGSFTTSLQGTIAYASTERNGRDFDLYLMPPGQTAQRILEREGEWAPGGWSEDGQKLLLFHETSALINEIWIMDLPTRQLSRLTPETPAHYDGVRFDNQGNLLVVGNPDREFKQLFEVDPETQTWTSLTEDIPWDIESFALAPDQKTLAISVNEGGISKLMLMSRKTRKRTPIPLPGQLLNGYGFAREGWRLLVGTSGPNLPGDVFTFDKKLNMTRWTQSETAGFDPASFIAPTLVDAHGVPAFYYRPPGPGPFPVVVLFHGGPEGQARPSFSAYTQALLRHNIAVLTPNVRGSTGYGRSYLAADDGVRREVVVQDIGSVLDWIANQPELDAGNVGVSGSSYGGFMVLNALVHFPERIRAGIDVVGIANFITFLEKTSPYRQDLRRVEYGDERIPEVRAFLEQFSPIAQIAKIRSALFVIHGANDPRVPVFEAEQIVRAARDQGQEAWYLLANNEGHGFRKLENAQIQLALQLQFFLQKFSSP